MTNTDNIYKREPSVYADRFLSGMRKGMELIEHSYGPAGSTVIVQSDLYPYHRVTNDGKEMLESVKLVDPIENVGLNFIKEAGDKADKDSGDGRKTTMILTESILQAASKRKERPLEIKKSLDECLPIILKHLDENTKEILPGEVGAIATIASENPQIGEILQEIYQKIGKEGIVELDVSNTFETTYEVKEGFRIRNAGFIAPYMANEGKSATYKKPKILITKQKIATLNDLNPLFELLELKDLHEIVIYCDEIDPNVLNALAFTHKRSIFKTLVIKSPILWKDWFYEDFAKITGATVVEPANGLTLATTKFEHLGSCEKITSTKEETTVIGTKDVSSYIANLLADNTEESKLRASWLQTKAAILKLGASSESELSYISKKARDGRNAAAQALRGGVVLGAGLSLMNARDLLPNTIGGEILKDALSKPTEAILRNMGIPSFTESSSVEDPALVVKNAITNAISISGTALTAKYVITLPAKEEVTKKHEDFQQMPGM